MNTPETPRRIQRVRHEIRFRDVRVCHIENLSPGFVALTFAGDALADFVSLGHDDHIKFVFQGPDGTEVRRDYTPRHHDAARQELTIEFALHEHGPAAEWARGAGIGQTAVIAGPRGSMVVPDDYDWYLLAGDASALPAIHRRLEELPAGARVMAVIQLDDPADQRHFATSAHLELHWVATADRLVEHVRHLPRPAGQGFAWAAGEADTMKALRQVLVEHWQQPKADMRVAAYWRRGSAAFHEELDRAAP